VSTFKFNLVRRSIRVEASLIRPVLDWSHVPARFFSMVYDALSKKVAVNPSDFSVNVSTVLNEAQARYNLFAGPASVVLRSDKLIFDFPIVIPSDYPIVRDVMSSIHDAFPNAFPELTSGRIDVQSAEHLELLEHGVDQFFDRFALPELEKSFGSPVVARPGVKFNVVAQDQSWECAFVSERSLLSATAVFILLNVTLRNADFRTPYADKSAAISALANSCRAVVGLEDANASVG
jgi:hypothetical protein